MADYTLAVQDQFPVGSTVDAYLASTQHPDATDAIPRGSIIDSADVADDCTLTFDGLTAGVAYVLYQAEPRKQFRRFTPA